MAMAVKYLLVALLNVLVLQSAYSEAVLLSNLNQILQVSTQFLDSSPVKLPALKAGEDEIEITWGYKTPVTVDVGALKVKLQLCYAPVSQLNRGWRKTNNDLTKDKTCQFDIMTVEDKSVAGTFKWKVTRVIPTATYFVRAYALDSTGAKVGYGQSTDKNKTTNLFQVEGISGRTTSLDIAAGVFSAFSVISLVAFFVFENTLLKKSK